MKVHILLFQYLTAIMKFNNKLPIFKINLKLLALKKFILSSRSGILFYRRKENKNDNNLSKGGITIERETIPMKKRDLSYQKKVLHQDEVW